MQVGQKVEEAEVWHDLAHVYSQLKQWEDAETCLEKARLLDSYSAATWHKTGEDLKLCSSLIDLHKKSTLLKPIH
jgi:hypothetical protein